MGLTPTVTRSLYWLPLTCPPGTPGENSLASRQADNVPLAFPALLHLWQLLQGSGSKGNATYPSTSWPISSLHIPQGCLGGSSRQEFWAVQLGWSCGEGNGGGSVGSVARGRWRRWSWLGSFLSWSTPPSALTSAWCSCFPQCLHNLYLGTAKWDLLCGAPPNRIIPIIRMYGNPNNHPVELIIQLKVYPQYFWWSMITTRWKEVLHTCLLDWCYCAQILPFNRNLEMLAVIVRQCKTNVHVHIIV